MVYNNQLATVLLRTNLRRSSLDSRIGLMNPSIRSTRRTSVRTSRRRGSSNVSATTLSSPSSTVSNEPSKSALEVTFCSIQRVATRSFLLLCTRANWSLYRLDGFSATRESCTPVQVSQFCLTHCCFYRPRVYSALTVLSSLIIIHILLLFLAAIRPQERCSTSRTCPFLPSLYITSNF